jgi:pimeloyl-ACP methyl ester carboxylesterase
MGRGYRRVLDIEPPGDRPGQPTASAQAVTDLRAALAAARVRVTLAPGSSHEIQWDRPELVIAATERLVAGVRGE